MLLPHAPFLPPQSRRGKRNEPALIIETLTKLAEVRGLSLEDAAAQTGRAAALRFAVDVAAFGITAELIAREIRAGRSARQAATKERGSNYRQRVRKYNDPRVPSRQTRPLLLP